MHVLKTGRLFTRGGMPSESAQVKIFHHRAIIFFVVQQPAQRGGLPIAIKGNRQGLAVHQQQGLRDRSDDLFSGQAWVVSKHLRKQDARHIDLLLARLFIFGCCRWSGCRLSRRVFADLRFINANGRENLLE